MTNFKAALDLPMHKNDANAKNIREYFYILLSKLWAEAEGFSGKRPFGNGSWQYDVYVDTINHKTADAYNELPPLKPVLVVEVS